MGDYKILGMYAAMSIVQGGPGFPFLHRHAYLYLCTDAWSPLVVNTECIPDKNIQEIVNKVGYLTIHRGNSRSILLYVSRSNLLAVKNH